MGWVRTAQIPAQFLSRRQVLDVDRLDSRRHAAG